MVTEGKLPRTGSHLKPSYDMHICLILNDAFSMVQFRAGLIQTLVRHGHQVTVVVPNPGIHREKLVMLGAEVEEIAMARFISPLADLLLIARIFLFLGRRRFDIVHTMTIKPNLYVPPIARLLRIPRVVGLVSGAGYLLGAKGAKEHPLLARLVKIMLRGSFACMNKVWFQNKDDRDHFIANRLLPASKCVVIRGGGIDIQEYSPELGTVALRTAKRSELGLSAECGIVLMVSARCIGAKGIREFANAAQICVQAHPSWRFVLIAPEDVGTPDAVPLDDPALKKPGLLFFSAFRFDIKELVAAADLIVLPSYYQEGLPRFLLEGLACGKPIVTTNHRGCRETVCDGENGYLVPPGDAHRLAESISKLMGSETLRTIFGRRSRTLCIEFFSEEVVCSRILSEVYAL